MTTSTAAAVAALAAAALATAVEPALCASGFSYLRVRLPVVVYSGVGGG